MSESRKKKRRTEGGGGGGSSGSRPREPGFGLFNSGDVHFDFAQNGRFLSKGGALLSGTGAAGTESRAVKGKRPMETTEKYYEGNWEMIQSQPELFAVLNEHMAKFFSAGMCFETDGKFNVPTGKFKTLVEEIIQPATARALIWLLCYSFVVWAETDEINEKTGAKTRTVFVPDPSQVDIEFFYAKNQTTQARLTWAENSEKTAAISTLHFFDKAPMGVSIGWQCSMVDAVSPLIDRLNTLEIARALVLDRAARPSIAVQEQPGSNGRQHIVDSDIPTLQRRDIVEFMDESDKRRIDMMTHNRVMEVIDAAYDEADERVEVVRVPPWRRLHRMLNTPPESRMMYIPIGMQAARPDTHPPDLAYNQTVLVIVGEIRRMMGVPIHQNEQETTHTQILLLDALGQVATEMLAVLYPGKNIRAVLMNRIRADREMSLELVKQGGMSPETFEVLHPPPDAKPKSSSSSASGTSSASQTRSMRKRFEEDY